MNIYFKYKILLTNNGTGQLSLLHKSMLVLIINLFLFITVLFTHAIAEELANQSVIEMQNATEMQQKKIKRLIEQQKRIKQLIKGLKSDDNFDRIENTEALIKIGLVAVPELIEALHDKNWYVRNGSAKALGKIGPVAKAAIPELIKALKDEFWDVSNNATEALIRIGLVAMPALIEALKDEKKRYQTTKKLLLLTLNPDEKKRYQIIKILGNFGHESKMAVPALIKNLKDRHWNIKNRSVEALGKIGPAAKAAISELIKILKYERKSDSMGKKIINSATEALGKIGLAAVPALIEALKNEKNRHRIVEALGNVGREAKAAVPVLIKALIKALKDKDFLICEHVAKALGKIGPEAKEAVPILIKTLKDKDDWKKEEVRYSAAEALGKIGPEAKAAVSALTDALKDKDSEVREYAAEALAFIDPNARADVLELIKAMRYTKDIYDRKKIARTLGTIGPEAKIAIPILIETLKNNGNKDAAETLGKFGPAAKAAVPTLIKALKSGHFDVRQSATVALEKIGTEAKAAVPVLIESLKYTYISENAAKALKAIGPATKTEISSLIKILKDENEIVSSHAFKMLVKIGKPAVSELIEDLKNDNDREDSHTFKILVEIGKPAVLELSKTLQGEGWKEVHSNVIRILEKIGPAAKPAVPALIKTLKDKKWNIRKNSAKALGAIGSNAKSAVSELVGILKDEVVSVRYNAAFALVAIGIKINSVASVLTEALKDKDKYVRTKATKALSDIGQVAKAAIPELVETLKDKEEMVQIAAAETLEKIGVIPQNTVTPDMVLTLITALYHKNERINSYATMVLEKIDVIPLDVMPDLINALQTKEQRIRSTVAKVLKNMGTEAREAIPALIKALDIKDLEVTTAINEALEKIGPSTETELNLIANLLNNSNPAVVRGAVVEIGKMGNIARHIVPKLITVLNTDILEKKVIMESLAKIGGKETIQGWIMALKLKDKTLRILAAEELQKIGSQAKAAISGLIITLKDIEPEVRAKASAALVAIGADAVPQLLQTLDDNDKNLQVVVINILGNIEPEANNVVKVLIDIVEDTGFWIFTAGAEDNLRTAAIEALGKLDDRQALLVLEVALNDNNEIIRKSAKQAIAKLGGLNNATTELVLVLTETTHWEAIFIQYRILLSVLIILLLLLWYMRIIGNKKIQSKPTIMWGEQLVSTLIAKIETKLAIQTAGPLLSQAYTIWQLFIKGFDLKKISEHKHIFKYHPRNSDILFLLAYEEYKKFYPVADGLKVEKQEKLAKYAEAMEINGLNHENFKTFLNFWQTLSEAEQNLLSINIKELLSKAGLGSRKFFKPKDYENPVTWQVRFQELSMPHQLEVMRVISWNLPALGEGLLDKLKFTERTWLLTQIENPFIHKLWSSMSWFIGTGKVEELKELAQRVASNPRKSGWASGDMDEISRWLHSDYTFSRENLLRWVVAVHVLLSVKTNFTNRKLHSFDDWSRKIYNCVQDYSNSTEQVQSELLDKIVQIITELYNVPEGFDLEEINKILKPSLTKWLDAYVQKSTAILSKQIKYGLSGVSYEKPSVWKKATTFFSVLTGLAAILLASVISGTTGFMVMLVLIMLIARPWLRIMERVSEYKNTKRSSYKIHEHNFGTSQRQYVKDEVLNRIWHTYFSILSAHTIQAEPKFSLDLLHKIIKVSSDLSNQTELLQILDDVRNNSEIKSDLLRNIDNLNIEQKLLIYDALYPITQNSLTYVSNLTRIKITKILLKSAILLIGNTLRLLSFIIRLLPYGKWLSGLIMKTYNILYMHFELPVMLQPEIYPVASTDPWPSKFQENPTRTQRLLHHVDKLLEPTTTQLGNRFKLGVAKERVREWKMLWHRLEAEGFRIEYGNFIDLAWLPWFFRVTNQSRWCRKGQIHLNLCEKRIVLSRYLPDYINALLLVKLSSISLGHAVLPRENYSLYLPPLGMAELQKGLLWRSYEYQVERGLNFLSGHLRALLNLFWLKSFANQYLYAYPVATEIVIAEQKGFFSHQLDRLLVFFSHLLPQKSTIHNLEKVKIIFGTKVEKNSLLSIFNLWELRHAGIVLIFFFTIFGSLLFHLDLSYINSYINDFIGWAKIHLGWLGTWLSALWSWGLIQWELVKEWVNKALTYIGLNIEILKSTWQWCKQELIAPIASVFHLYIEPIFYIIIMPLWLYMLGLLYGGILFFAGIEGRIRRLSDQGIHLWFIKSGSLLGELTGEILYLISIKRDFSKVVGFVQSMSEWFYRQLRSPLLWTIGQIMRIGIIGSLFLYLLLLFSLSFPPLDWAYIFHVTQSVGVPLNIYVILVVVTFFIGLPYLSGYNWYYRLPTGYVWNKIRKAMLGVSFFIAVVLPGGMYFYITHVPADWSKEFLVMKVSYWMRENKWRVGFRELFIGQGLINPYTGWPHQEHGWEEDYLAYWQLSQEQRQQNREFYGNSPLLLMLLQGNYFWPMFKDIVPDNRDVIVSNMLEEISSLVTGKLQYTQPLTYRERLFFAGEAQAVLKVLLFGSVLQERIAKFPDNDKYSANYALSAEVWEKSWKLYQNLSDNAYEPYLRKKIRTDIAQVQTAIETAKDLDINNFVSGEIREREDFAILEKAREIVKFEAKRTYPEWLNVSNRVFMRDKQKHLLLQLGISLERKMISTGVKWADMQWYLADLEKSKEIVIRYMLLSHPEVIKVWLTNKENTDVHHIIAKALEDIGPQDKIEIPALIKSLKDENKWVRANVANALQAIGPVAKDAVPALTKALQDEMLEVRKNAIEALEAMGSHAKIAIPMLIKMLKSKNRVISQNAAFALIAIDQEEKAAVPMLIKALNNEDSNVRDKASKILENLNPETKVPALIKALMDNELKDRNNAILVLENIGPEAKEAVPILLNVLKDENKIISQNAAFALAAIGQDTKTVIPTLIEALKNGETVVRKNAAKALGIIGSNAKAAVFVLINALKDEDIDISQNAAFALIAIDQEEKAAVPMLIKALNNEDLDVRDKASKILENLKPETKVPALIKALMNNELEDRNNAILILENIGPEAKEAVPILLNILKDENKIISQNAAFALVAIGQDTKTVTPTLIEALKNGETVVRRKAAKALGIIGSNAKAAVFILINALKDEDIDIRKNAAEALGKIGYKPKTVIPKLIYILKDEDIDVRTNAARALEKIGPEAKAAVPALIKTLRKIHFNTWYLDNNRVRIPMEGRDDEAIRINAAIALGKIGPEAKAAVPALIEALKNEGKKFIYVSIRALGEIGPEAKEAIPALTKLLNSKDDYVKKAAKEAIEKICNYRRYSCFN